MNNDERVALNVMVDAYGYAIRSYNTNSTAKENLPAARRKILLDQVDRLINEAVNMPRPTL